MHKIEYIIYKRQIISLARKHIILYRAEIVTKNNIFTTNGNDSLTAGLAERDDQRDSEAYSAADSHSIRFTVTLQLFAPFNALLQKVDGLGCSKPSSIRA